MGQDLLLRYHPNSPFRTHSLRVLPYAKRTRDNVRKRRPYYGNPVQFALTGPFMNAYAPCSHHCTALWSASADITPPAQRFMCLLCTVLFYHTFYALSRGKIQIISANFGLSQSYVRNSINAVTEFLYTDPEYAFE